MSSESLRVAVTPPSGHMAIPARASDVLGYDVSMQVLPTEALFAQLQSGELECDLVQVEVWMIEDLDGRGLIDPVPAASIDRYEQISPLYTEGLLSDRRVADFGTPPWRVLFADQARAQSSAWLRAVPTVSNADTLGWRTDRMAEPVDSWGALVDPANAGRVALADVPAVSHVELSLALQACGLVKYEDIGQQSAAEVDATYRALGRLKNGHFFDFWESFEGSIKVMTDGPVAVQSCWPPAVTELRARGVPVNYSVLREGGRGWCGGFALVRGLTEERRQQALGYINWYLDGWPGALLARQGYYASTPEAVRQWMDEGEWAYWYEGAAAEAPVHGPDGRIIHAAGLQREGGSFLDRMSRIACWNTRMAEEPRIRRHWQSLKDGASRQNVNTVPDYQSPS